MAKYRFPSWKGYLLINPMRYLFQNPERILGDYVEPGMSVLDFGCSMGYFSIPVAKMVGENGRVICVDVDQKQLNVLRSRARKRNLIDRLTIQCIEPSCANFVLPESSVDLALLLQVLHYMNAPVAALRRTHDSLKNGATMLVAEPKSHLTESEWDDTLQMVADAGFAIGEQNTMYNLRMAVARKE